MSEIIAIFAKITDAKIRHFSKLTKFILEKSQNLTFKMDEKIRQIIEFYGLNVRQFEQKISASEGQIYKYLSRGGGLNSDTVAKILDNFPDISPDWLLLGKGEMLRSEAPKAAPSSAESDRIWKEILADKDRRIEELIIENYQIREQVAHIQAITPPHYAMD